MKLSKFPFAAHLYDILLRKRRRPSAAVMAVLAVLLGVGLASCRPDQTEPPADSGSIPSDAPLESASPPPEESEALSPALGDGQTVLDTVDAIFETRTYMQCFLFPATGPLSLRMDDYQEEVRKIFTQYTWTLGDEASYQEDHSCGWILYLTSYGGYTLTAIMGSDWIRILSSGENGTEALFFRAESGSGDLVHSLVDLWDGPSTRYTFVSLPGDIDEGQSLANAYADAFQELYLASGAITEFDLQDLAVLPKENEDSSCVLIQMTFAVKPADPAAPCWQNAPTTADGWVAFSTKLSLEILEGVWRCSYLWNETWVEPT